MLLQYTSRILSFAGLVFLGALFFVSLFLMNGSVAAKTMDKKAVCSMVGREYTRCSDGFVTCRNKADVLQKRCIEAEKSDCDERRSRAGDRCVRIQESCEKKIDSRALKHGVDMWDCI